ncbi:MAG TPA: class I SAM-dependent methyltransferase [Desulfomonilaceae bacterium]|nr:class I SAM-dependent methyltransferase [Desulfomonilaceae bacterium]
MTQRQTFSFGKNWQKFLKGFDEERVKIAERSLTEFLNLPDLRGKSFLDIGSGSGLFSYAALNLGATRIVSFDVDAFSVQCCRYLHSLANNPANWEIYEGSILDKTFLDSLGSFDIVYSWGVLHHTGKMWESIVNSCELVAPHGYYYIALYNKVTSRNGAPSWIHPFWLSVKRLHNAHPALGRYVLEPAAMAAYAMLVMARLENPAKHVRNYRSNRGMSWGTDAADWLGGYPYEFATVEEVFKFIKEKFPDFNLINIKTTSGRGLNWYLFLRH